MTISLSLMIFATLVIVMQVISEVFTILFMMTGLPERIARFQVVSLLTMTGYTTREAENILDDQRRRTLAKIIMVFGYCFSATIVSIFVNLLLNIGKDHNDDFWVLSSVIMGVMVIVLLLFRVRFFRKYIDRFIFKISGKLMFGKYENYVMVIDDYGENCVAYVKIRNVPDKFRDKTLQDLDFNAKYGILILAIKRGNNTINSVGKEEYFETNDLLIVHGQLHNIKKTFEIDNKKSNKKHGKDKDMSSYESDDDTVCNLDDDEK